jgi:hypothetical protein
MIDALGVNIKVMKTKMGAAQPEGTPPTKIDPVLLQQINAVATDAAPVEAVIMLRPDDPAQIAAPPNRAEELTHQILQRVEKQIGISAQKVNIFRNLGSFALSANPNFIRELLRQPEVASAIANKRPPQAYIPPIDVEPVKPGSNRGWRSSSGAGKKSAGRVGKATSAARKTAKAGKSARASKSHK